MAASDIITIKIQGRGRHGGVAPQYTVDPVLIAGAIISAVHSIVGRNLNPLGTGVISLCGISGGSLEAFNVIPDEVVISGTVRSLRAEVQETIEVTASGDRRGGCPKLAGAPLWSIEKASLPRSTPKRKLFSRGKQQSMS